MALWHRTGKHGRRRFRLDLFSLTDCSKRTVWVDEFHVDRVLLEPVAQEQRLCVLDMSADRAHLQDGSSIPLTHVRSAESLRRHVPATALVREYEGGHRIIYAWSSADQ